MRALFSLLLSLPAALSWGQTGHRLTGAIAQKFVEPATAYHIKNLLPRDWKGSLWRTATWADEIKGGKLKQQYAWASELHYVDSKDDPPRACGFDYARDCPDGKCVVGAIANFTHQLSCSFPDNVRSEALKFTVHFIGDIAQPLHTCDRMRGGNDATVLFDGKKKNLHSIWDTAIVEKRILEEFGNSTAAYVDYLTYQLNTKYRQQAIKWTQCLNQERTAHGDALSCAAAWAADSDDLNCSVVWMHYETNPNDDFGHEYYERSWRTVEKQILKAGVRMAAWFDHFVRDCGRRERVDNE